MVAELQGHSTLSFAEGGRKHAALNGRRMAMGHELTMRRAMNLLFAQRETLAKASVTILAVSSWGKRVGVPLRLPGYIT